MTAAPKRTLAELARGLGMTCDQLKAHMAQASRRHVVLPKPTAHSAAVGNYYDTREFMAWWRSYQGAQHG